MTNKGQLISWVKILRAKMKSIHVVWLGICYDPMSACRLSQVDVLSKQLNGRAGVWHVCCPRLNLHWIARQFGYLQEQGYFSLELCPKLYSKLSRFFCFGTPIVTKVVARPTTVVILSQHPSLFAICLPCRISSRGFVCDSWDLSCICLAIQYNSVSLQNTRRRATQRNALHPVWTQLYSQLVYSVGPFSAHHIPIVVRCFRRKTTPDKAFHDDTTCQAGALGHASVPCRLVTVRHWLMMTTVV